MAKKTGAEQNSTAPAATPKKRRPTAWKAGQSGNPKGRPRSGESLAEIVRSEVSPKALIKRMQSLADNAESEQVRVHALTWLADRGYGKAPQVVELVNRNPFADRAKAMTTEQLEVAAMFDEESEADVSAGDVN